MEKSYDYDKKSRNTGCICCLCCWFWVAVFLILFFLIPRDPYIWVRNVSSQTIDGEASLMGKIAITNRNWFYVDWKDPYLKLFWLPDNGQTLSAACTGTDEAQNLNEYDCDFTRNGYCAVRIGAFTSDDKLGTKALANKNWKMDLDSADGTQLACRQQMQSVALIGGNQRLLTKGSIKAKLSLYASTQGWTKESIHEQTYIFSA